MSKIRVLLLAVGLLLGSTQSAFAHAELIKSFPVANSTLTKSPSFIQLEFGETLTSLKSKTANSITILDSKSHNIATTKISVKKGIARVELIDTLKSGRYTVKYRVVSADGHVIKSQFKFTLR